MLNALDFLNTIFRDKPITHHILIWELNRQTNTKSNNFFTDIDKAAKFATRAKTEGTDTYFCVGSLANKPSIGRGKIRDISGIGGLHLDIDIQHPMAHKKKNLPPTKEKAIEFINHVDIKPTVLNDSGYGLHAYWLFKKFWVFKDDEDKLAAMKMLEDWQHMFKLHASQSNWDIDATQDITRVLRVPDTLNWKVPDSPVEDTIICIDENLRYTHEQIEEYLLKTRSVGKTVSLAIEKATVKPDPKPLSFNDIQIEIHPNADVTSDVLISLMDNVSKFKLTWERKRKDLQDTSASSYDMALANMAISSGLDDQTTVNLLIANRRKHGDEKLRLDYYQRTIAAAKTSINQRHSASQALKMPADSNQKDAMRKAIEIVLGIRIERIEKMVKDPADFTIFFENGISINIGNSKALLKQDDFRCYVGDAINKVPKKLNSVSWENIVQKLFAMVEVVEPDEDLTLEGQFKEQILKFLKYRGFYSIEEEYRQILANSFSCGISSGIIGDFLCIHAETLWIFIKMHYNKQTERKTVIANLKRIGANRITKNIRNETKVISYSLYELPVEFTQSLMVHATNPTSKEEVNYAAKPAGVSPTVSWLMNE